jgi:putative spermidine/putrescine transport system ATP-binding protein/spermidine/putrescine transport system ATP-binding protein
VQIGPPQLVYERPVSVFAAQFLGDANIIRGEATGHALTLADGTHVRTDGVTTGIAIVRPEKIVLRSEKTVDGTNQLEGEVVQAIYSGASVTYRMNVKGLGGEPFLVFAQNQTGEVLSPGARAVASFAPQHTIPVAP